MTTAEVPQIQITLPPLHPRQLEIAKHPARFRVVCCGRRWGKTLLAATLLVRDALKGKRLWHVAPSYKQTKEGWAYLQQLVSQMPPGVARTSVSDLKIHFVGGGSVELRTGDDPKMLRGSGLDGVVLDEAAFLKEDAWTKVLRPALADKQGWALFISTPDHFNWFHGLFEKGENHDPDWASWQSPTWDNPYIPEEEIEAARRDMADEDFLQEFAASFTAVGGAVFKLLIAHRPVYLRPMPNGLEWKRVGIGMDWGTTEAHNAAVVCGGVTRDGSVWIRSSWLNSSGDDNAWFDEAQRCRRDYKATFARVDRSQSSARGRLGAMGYEADTGVADVEARVGAYQGLIQPRRIFFDSNGPGVREFYNHLCTYHRDPDTGKPVEIEDDDVDAGGYMLKELVAVPLHDRASNVPPGARYAPATSMRGV